MITAAAVESAYSFFHQKARVYAGSHIPSQRDDIEYAIAQYLELMSCEKISGGKPNFLKDHATFGQDIELAVRRLDEMMQGE